MEHIAYLDNSSTTKPSKRAVQYITRALESNWGNPSSLHRIGMEAEIALNDARECIARTVNARADEIFFTGSGTEANNTALLSVLKAKSRGGRIITTAIEHPSVLETVKRLEDYGFEVVCLKPDNNGIIPLSVLENALTDNTLLVSMMLVNNETGAIQPVAELARMARARNRDVRVHVDGVQGFMRVPMHMGRQGIDLYSLSGHKIHGPKGIGALVVRGNLRLAAQMTGGGQEKGLRSGTTDSPAILGLDEAVRQMAARRQEVEGLRAMKRRLWERVSCIEGARVNGPLPDEADSAPHILSLSFAGVRGEVLRNALEGEGVLVSTGSACASHRQKVSASLRAMGLSAEQADGTIRVSLGLFNSMDEMDETAERLARICGVLSRYRRR